MIFKLGLVFVLGVFGLRQVSAACDSSGPHDLIVGARQPGDTLLFSTHEAVSSSFMKTKSKDVVYPASGQPAFHKITSIQVTNQIRNNGDAGCVYLTAGGPSTYGATIHIKTQRGGAYDFIVNVYGTNK